METSTTQKERTHRLIRQGGLIDVAGLQSLDADVLLGLLIHAKRYYEGLSPEQIDILRQSGDAMMQQRREANQQLLQTQNQSIINPFLR